MRVPLEFDIRSILAPIVMPNGVESDTDEMQSGIKKQATSLS